MKGPSLDSALWWFGAGKWDKEATFGVPVWDIALKEKHLRRKELQDSDIHSWNQ